MGSPRVLTPSCLGCLGGQQRRAFPGWTSRESICLGKELGTGLGRKVSQENPGYRVRSSGPAEKEDPAEPRLEDQVTKGRYLQWEGVGMVTLPGVRVWVVLGVCASEEEVSFSPRRHVPPDAPAVWRLSKRCMLQKLWFTVRINRPKGPYRGTFLL